MLMHILELEVERNLQQAQNADDPLVIHIIEGQKDLETLCKGN